MRKGPGEERGSVLPLTLMLLTFALLVGLEAALVAGSVRWGAARARAGEQAYRHAEAGLALAARVPVAEMERALAGADLLDLARSGALFAGVTVEVRVLDDDDGDVARDINGRVRLQSRGTTSLGPDRWPAERWLDAEALVGALTPSNTAVLDCTGSIALCGGVDGCELPTARLAGSAAALGVPVAELPALRRRLWELMREVIRRVDERCGAPAGCDSVADDLWRAAATDVLRVIDGPTGDAVSLTAVEVGRLVSNLVALNGDESGTGWMTWIDGTTRPVMRMESVVAVLTLLLRPGGHVPDLAAHSLTSFLAAPVMVDFDRGACGRLRALVAAAKRSARPLDPTSPGAGTFVLAAPLGLLSGGDLTGEGLLVLEAPLSLAAGSRLSWRGAVVLAGGSIDGPGAVDLHGGLVDLGGRPAGTSGFSLMATAWEVAVDAASWRRAWLEAGTVVLARWERVAGQ